MIIAHHLIWTAYGWWLPNDPRGSMSLDIRVEELEPLGEMHYGRKAQQPRSAELRKFYGEAADLLKHPLLTFAEMDFPLLAKAFEEVIGEQRYTCYACAIMPDHVHMLIRRHRDKAEMMIENFQTQSRNAVIEAGLRSITHPVWGGPGWKVFQNSSPVVSALPLACHPCSCYLEISVRHTEISRSPYDRARRRIA
jgi:hypothetical protein